MPARSAPSVASSPAIVHAAIIEAGGLRPAARLLGIPYQTVYDHAHGLRGQMTQANTEKIGRRVDSLDRNARAQLVGTANVIRDRARGSAARMGAERVALQLETPADRQRMVRERARQQTASDQQYERFLRSQRERTRSPVRVPTRAGPFPDVPPEIARY